MTAAKEFVHLHTHTEYSFLDGAIRIPDLVERARTFGMPALALTDHGGLFGAVEFYNTCLKNGVKPILGFEAYIAPGSRKEKNGGKDERSYHHLVLLAKNNEGWKNLLRLSTIGYTEGFYYKPRIDTEVLRAFSGGLIGCSACVAGAIPRALLANDEQRAENLAREYLSIFGEGNFYIELQNHGIEEETIVLERLISLGNKCGIPFIATNDAHYLNKVDAESHEILLCMQTQTTLENPNRYRFSSDEIYFKSPEEMAVLFPDIPEAYTNTLDIAERCNVDIKAKPQLPAFSVPDTYENQADYLTHLARDGLQKKYGTITPALEERLSFELETILSMGFQGYFLIVRDFVLAAKHMGIMVGCRGSAAGSLVAYTIDITDVDPIKFDLVFERFLNPERISLPDADIDFADHDRSRVIDYVIETYGRDAVCQIINFGRMKAKMVVKDVARVMGISPGEAQRLSNMVNEKTLEKSVAANGELKRMIEEQPVYKELFRHAAVLEGLVRQAGMHAGGVIIAPGEVIQWAPLFKQATSDILMTQFDMNYVEQVGLIKMDFLGLRTLTVLQEACRLIDKHHGCDLDLWNIPDSDEKTFALFGRGDTTGIFQFESQGMQDYLRKLKPTRIEDLIAMAALYRPGPMDNIDTFIHRKHGKEKIEYLHPALEDILNVTYGVIVYQEQVMRIAQVMGGFSLGQADILRKAMGKKIEEKMKEMSIQFIEGAKKKHIDEKTASAVFDLMAKFAQYGFNKAHATVYAHVSYQAAYLKAHYPLEYMTATLTSWIGKKENFLVMKNEAERMAIPILPPDCNLSEFACSSEKNGIRLGLGIIAHIDKAADAILGARAQGGSFTSLFDFCSRVDVRSVNRKAIESLICAGAMDCFAGTRAQLFTGVQQALDYGDSIQKDRRLGQTNLFDMMTGGADTSSTPVIPEPVLPDIPPWSYHDLLAREKEVLNFYVSGHPLDRFRDELRGFSSISLHPERQTKLKPNGKVTIGGMITTVKTHTQRNGKLMAFVELEDFDGTMEVLVFGDVYDEFKHLIAEDAMVLVNGRVLIDENENRPKLRAERFLSLSESRERLAKSIHIKIRTQGLEKEFLETIRDECKTIIGDCPLIVHLITQEDNEFRIRSNSIKIKPDAPTLRMLRSRVGNENVWLSKTTA